MKLSFLIGSLLLFSSCIAQDATAVVRKADAKMRGNTMEAEITIKTTRPTWTREMQCRTWLKGNNLSMILIQAPAKDKGISFLKRKKEVWNWLPSLERTIKLPPSMMTQSWMGTDFTNDDLVKESSMVEDYAHSFLGDTIVQGLACYTILLLPKPESAVVWSKVIICIDKTDFMELHSRFYDEDQQLVNTINGFEIKMMDDRKIPTHFEIIPADKKGQKTEMIYRSVRYNRPIDDNFFTVEKMKALN